MATVVVNESAIRSAIDSIVGKTNGEAVSWAIANGAMKHTPEEAGEKFVEVLKSNIAGCGLSEGVASALGDVVCSGATDLGDGHFTVSVSFAGDLFRFSLDPDRYGGIDNLAALYNYGVGHTMRQVFGYWHGELTGSRTVIPGAHFMEAAVAEFMGSYAAEYGVTGIDIMLGS